MYKERGKNEKKEERNKGEGNREEDKYLEMEIKGEIF